MAMEATSTKILDNAGSNRLSLAKWFLEFLGIPRNKG